MAARGTRTRRIGGVTLLATIALGVGVAQAGGDHVKGSNFAFKPKTIKVHRGERVHWSWVEGRHTVTFKKGSFDEPLTRKHSRVSRRFHKRGTFRYYCRFHRSLGMKGKVVVK